MDSPKLLLNDFEKEEVTTTKIIKYFNERLTKLRIDNDSLDSDPLTRGRIAEIKTFIQALERKNTAKAPKHTRTM